MLASNFTISYLKIRSYFFITFFSLSFCQYFIVPQRPIYDLLKWEEINSNQILIPKVGPLKNTDLASSYFSSFYYSDTMTNGVLTGEIFPEVNINNTDGIRLQLYGTVGITLSDRLIMQNEFEFDNKGINDPHFKGVERGLDNGWVGYLQHSSLTYNYLSGHFSIGRGNPYFYNMNESLLINPQFPPAEYLWWHHEVQWLQYDWGLLMLNEKETLNRFLTFHRYGIKKKNWRIGFTEAVMGTYDQWGPKEMGYIMPAAVHLETEENRGINANLMWLIDGMFKRKQWIFYGELLIDDFALDGQSPPQIAGSIGLGRKFENNTLINVEYIRINRWTGNYCDSLKRWAEMDIPIGHSLGSDAHQIKFSSYLPINNKLDLEIFINGIESGEGSGIDRLKAWPENVACDNNFGENESPQSYRDTSYYAGSTWHYLFKDNILANMDIGFRDKEVLWNLSISYNYQ